MHSGGGLLVYEQWNSLTSFSSSVFSDSESIGSYLAIRITDDGTNRKYYWSRNELEYMLVYSEADTTFTGTANSVGIRLPRQQRGQSNPHLALQLRGEYVGVATG